MTILSHHAMLSNRYPEIYRAVEGLGHIDIFNFLKVFELWDLSNVLHVYPNKRQ